MTDPDGNVEWHPGETAPEGMRRVGPATRGDAVDPAVAGLYRHLLDLARPYLDTRGNEEHTEASVAFAWRLLESEGGDHRVVIPGVIFHDVGWSSIPEDSLTQAFGPAPTRPDLLRLHERESARIAREILVSIDYDLGLTEEIAEIVGHHDSTASASSRNDALVKDADKLYRLTQPGYVFFLDLFGLDYRGYLNVLAARADRWFFTETAKGWADDMLADLDAYARELDAAAGSDAGRTDQGAHKDPTPRRLAT
jgi:HD superfamily phosphodiesterase